MASRSRKRILVASANPWSFCMAVERDLAATHAEDQVDAIDLFRLSGRHSPHWRLRDKLIETLNRKIDRFVMPAIAGRNISRDVIVDRTEFPPVPDTYEALRSYEVGAAKIGLVTPIRDGGTMRTGSSY